MLNLARKDTLWPKQMSQVEIERSVRKLATHPRPRKFVLMKLKRSPVIGIYDCYGMTYGPGGREVTHIGVVPVFTSSKFHGAEANILTTTIEWIIEATPETIRSALDEWCEAHVRAPF